MSSNISRRCFLKDAAALALACGASGVLAGCAAAPTNELPAASEAVTPSGEAYISGAKTGSITIQADCRVDILVTNVQAIRYNNSLALELQVTNGIKTTDLAIRDSTGPEDSYTLVATIRVNDEEADVLPGAGLKEVTEKFIHAGETGETAVVFSTQLKNWSTAEITLALYDKGAPLGAPVVFVVNK